MERAYLKLQRYAGFDTMSDESSTTCPSTPGQLVLARALKKEMLEMGLVDVTLDDNGYLFATLPANTDKAGVPTIGFLAHLDTSPDFPGECKHSRILAYEGGDIRLNETTVTAVDKFPILKQLVGEDLLVTDGDHLLGADNKAGIAEILSAMEYLMAHPEIRHGKIRIGFTPDEEIGRGPHKFDVAAFGADFAYTMDGDVLGDINYESFNAASAHIQIKGASIHPGSAKNKLINASLIGMELNGLLPVAQRPEHTEGYEGFFLLTRFSGMVDHAELKYIIRDHDRAKFEEKKALLTEIVRCLNVKYPDAITLDIRDSYYNMRDVIEQRMELVDVALAAMADCGVTPDVSPIRGGTDGSQLSYMGLPAPNIFVGAFNFHGPYEMAVLSWMDKAVEVIVRIISRFEARA